MTVLEHYFLGHTEKTQKKHKTQKNKILSVQTKIILKTVLFLKLNYMVLFFLFKKTNQNLPSDT